MSDIGWTYECVAVDPATGVETWVGTRTESNRDPVPPPDDVQSFRGQFTADQLADPAFAPAALAAQFDAQVAAKAALDDANATRVAAMKSASDSIEASRKAGVAVAKVT